jgi:hypothetical protein
MSADGSITLVWGDGEQKFRFAIGQFRELQEKVNQRRVAVGALPAGPMMLLNQLRANDAWPDDVRDVLRLGLIGGGAKPAEAHRLMSNYFDNSPPLEHMQPAFLVLLAGLAGAPGEPLDGKKKTETEMPANRSGSDDSTAPALQ